MGHPSGDRKSRPDERVWEETSRPPDEHGSESKIECPVQGVTALAGRFADDPALREICADIYRERDADTKP